MSSSLYFLFFFRMKFLNFGDVYNHMSQSHIEIFRFRFKIDKNNGNEPWIWP